ncbi:glycogen debranching protein [Sulfolobus acidocaldarius SUSAZ]|nr:glycogen debranching protein [Sulfolobus acidocaldarius SUSAZ]
MHTPEECERKEWLLTFGTGGYSSSTICGINSRTYHGYLVVPLNPPHKRYLILSKFEDFLVLNREDFPLSTNHYSNAYYPDGYKYLKHFHWGRNYVKWIYDVNGIIVEKLLIASQGTNGVTIKYKATDGSIKVYPLMTFRSHHLVSQPENLIFTQKVKDNLVSLYRYDGSLALNFVVENKFKLTNTGYSYYDFFYVIDYELGNNSKENLYNPFFLTSEKNELTIHAYHNSFDKSEIKETPSDIIKLLGESSLNFLVKGHEGYSIVTGYHWFDEWGRDTFISLEGILLLQGLYDQAKEIINRYLQYNNKGLLPNHITPSGEPIYLGVDVSLWAINAIYKLYSYSRDTQFIRKIYPILQDIVESYMKGNGIVYTMGEILFHRGAPRTWMDASYNGRIVTPREGAAVEINALWYNALMILDYFSKILGDSSSLYREVAEKVKRSFMERFVTNWGLYDYLTPSFTPDNTIRPNQIFAISLPFNILPIEKGKSVMVTIEKELLRSYGLSTLSSKDPKYKPVYRGERAKRDEAYHNGLVWPWLIGAYVDAKLRYETDIVRSKLLLDTFKPLLEYAKLHNGFIPELFEDVPPYSNGGAIAQAWSVAEVYRAMNKLISL